MLTLIEGLPEGAVGVTATGKVVADDYEKVLAPAIEKALEDHEKIRFLYVFEEDFKRFSAGALWDDARIGLKHFKAFERTAIVADDKWVRGTVKGFGWLFPGEVHVYGLADRATAETWITEGLAVQA